MSGDGQHVEDDLRFDTRVREVRFDVRLDLRTGRATATAARLPWYGTATWIACATCVATQVRDLRGLRWWPRLQRFDCGGSVYMRVFVVRTQNFFWHIRSVTTFHYATARRIASRHRSTSAGLSDSTSVPPPSGPRPANSSSTRRSKVRKRRD